jgi:hypothetical protein
MTGKLSTYLKNALYNGVLRNIAYTPPATVYLALYTTDPTAADVGAEVAGGSYARQAIAFGAPTAGAGVNSGIVTFPTATAPWGTITHFGLRDAVAAGNLLLFGQWTTGKAVTTDDIAKVLASALAVTFE